MARRIALETWDPSYGVPADSAILEASDVDVDASVEIPPNAWRPITPPSSTKLPDEILFIDGVRRTDAHAWITDGNERPFPAILASYAAGAALAGSRAQVIAAECRRVLIAPNETSALTTRAGTWTAHVAQGDTTEQMSLALQTRLTDLEIEIARQHGGRTPLIVVDGPLRGRQDISGAIGYVKTHQVAYLPADLQSVVADLVAGQRTPIFRCTTSWSRYSWYLRLPGPASHDWWGIVRIEVSEALEIGKATELANVTAAVLPRFASTPHKDPRAPQNLFPIAGLERELRRRLGDREFVERVLRRAAATRIADQRSHNSSDAGDTYSVS